MEFMWLGVPPSASCPLLLALLFMFARGLPPPPNPTTSTHHQPSRQTEAGSERLRLSRGGGGGGGWLVLRFEVSCDQPFNTVGCDRRSNLVLSGFIHRSISL